MPVTCMRSHCSVYVFTRPLRAGLPGGPRPVPPRPPLAVWAERAAHLLFVSGGSRAPREAMKPRRARMLAGAPAQWAGAQEGSLPKALCSILA